MRIIGLDIHRAFAEAVAWEDGKLKRLGRVEMRRPLLAAFAATLTKADVVVIEATGNASAAAGVIGPHVKRVVIANPKQVRIIAHAKIKTDTIDAGVLAQLYASGFLPEVWIPNEATQALRRQVTRRHQIVRQRSRLKNIIQSILHSHLIPSCPHQDLCGPRGRSWLAAQIVPEDERLAIERHLREFDRLGEDLKVIEARPRSFGLGGRGSEAADDDPGRRHGGGARPGGRHRPGDPLRCAAQACQLSRPEPERPAVGTRTCVSWAPSKGAATPAACWSRRPGRRRGHQAHCAPSSSVSGPGAASTWRPSRLLANLLS